jgi:hypothetical protein
MWPLLVALTAMISPCTSSSANGSGVWGCRGGVPSFSFNSSSPCVDVPSSVGAWEPSSDVPWCPSGAACSVPSWDSCVCSGFVCLVAAKTEGEEMGQYVMAVYKQLGAAFARPITLRGVIIHGARSGCCRVASRGCVMFGGEQPGRGAAAQAPTPSLTAAFIPPPCFVCRFLLQDHRTLTDQLSQRSYKQIQREHCYVRKLQVYVIRYRVVRTPRTRTRHRSSTSSRGIRQTQIRYKFYNPPLAPRFNSGYFGIVHLGLLSGSIP